MLDTLYNVKVLIYTMIGIFVFGMLLKIALAIGYSRMIRASNNMGSTTYKLFRNLKLKFETFHKLKINVNNVDTFVDKCINNHKILGILLITWEKISGQVGSVSFAIGLIGAILYAFLEFERMWILSVFLVGFLSGGLLIFFEALLNKKAKREIIRLNIIDYLENYLNNRLEQEAANPKLIEAYKKYFANQKDMVVENFVAAADEAVQIELEEDEDACNGKDSFRMRRLKAREDRKRRKEEKRATRLFKKQAKRAARAKRKEDRIKNRLKAKKEKQLRIEEKRREAEIKKALKLEKKLSSQAKRKNKITPAQQRKESLKQEIKELRKLESRKGSKDTTSDMELEYEYETVRSISEINQCPYTNKLMGFNEDRAVSKAEEPKQEKLTSNVTGIDEGRARRNVEGANKLGGASRPADTKTGSKDDQVAATREDSILKGDRNKEEIRTSRTSSGNMIRRRTRLSKEDKQIIEDILKEYLA